MTDPVEQLVSAIRDSIGDQTFQKLTLGKFQNELAAVQHVYVRIVDLKTGPHLSFVYRYPNQDITKNSPIPEGIEIITSWLGSTCRSATLFTSKARQQLLFSRRGKPRLFSQDSVSLPATEHSHDREKVRLLRDERALELLGVIDSEGRPRAQMGNKYRQVHHFIEALAPILKGTKVGTASVTTSGSCRAVATSPSTAAAPPSSPTSPPCARPHCRGCGRPRTARR